MIRKNITIEKKKEKVVKHNSIFRSIVELVLFLLVIVLISSAFIGATYIR